MRSVPNPMGSYGPKGCCRCWMEQISRKKCAILLTIYSCRVLKHVTLSIWQSNRGLYISFRLNGNILFCLRVNNIMALCRCLTQNIYACDTAIQGRHQNYYDGYLAARQPQTCSLVSGRQYGSCKNPLASLPICFLSTHFVNI